MDVLLQVADKPEALMAHLGKNLDLAEELADLTPIQLAKKLGRIEDSLARTSTLRNSTAPTPLEAVRGSGPATKSLDDMSFEEYSAARRRFINGRKR